MGISGNLMTIGPRPLELSNLQYLALLDPVTRAPSTGSR